MAVMERTWFPAPLYFFTDDRGLDAILPTEDDIAELNDSIKRTGDDLKTVSARDDESAAERVKGLTALLEIQEANAKRIVADVEAKKSASKLKNYELGKPTFLEFTRAEEGARTWIDATPRVDETKMFASLLRTRVRLDGRVLTDAEIDEMEPAEGIKLMNLMRARCFPDVSRLPFWSLPSPISARASSEIKQD